MKIEELTNLLRAVKIDFTSRYDAALRKKQNELKEVIEKFQHGTKYYREEIARIEKEFETTIVRERMEVIASMEPYFAEIVGEETDKAGKIDTVAFEKISALKDLPLTETELSVINSKYGAKDYYSARMLAMIAEKNGINPAAIGIVPSLDTRLNIINALKGQLDMVLTGYKPEHKGHHAESPERKAHTFALAALSENTLNDLVLKYTNGYDEKRSRQVVKATFERIAGTVSESERALLISNALRNVKGQSRNELLYKLSSLENLSEYTLLLSGCEEEITEWKKGKAEQYASALKFVQEISSINDVTAVKQKILEEINSPFVEDFIISESKNNKIIRNAISEGDTTEDNATE